MIVSSNNPIDVFVLVAHAAMHHVPERTLLQMNPTHNAIARGPTVDTPKALCQRWALPFNNHRLYSRKEEV